MLSLIWPTTLPSHFPFFLQRFTNSINVTFEVVYFDDSQFGISSCWTQGWEAKNRAVEGFREKLVVHRLMWYAWVEILYDEVCLEYETDNVILLKQNLSTWRVFQLVLNFLNKPEKNKFCFRKNSEIIKKKKIKKPWKTPETHELRIFLLTDELS